MAKLAIVETDIHPFVKGVTFEKIWRSKVKAKYGNVWAYFASLNDLISMKKAAGRPKDTEDLKFLIRLKKSKNRHSPHNNTAAEKEKN